MAYWWVNQGDTFEQARDLGILWAPLEDKSGHKQPHWETMAELREGDVVFHFAKTKIRGISTVENEARIAEIKIKDRGQWNNLGREVDVLAQDFDFILGLDDIPLELRTNSGTGVGTPFNLKGKVKQGYLFGLPTSVAEHLLAELSLVNLTSPIPVEQQVNRLLKGFEGRTDKLVHGKLRREQRALRQRLFGENRFFPCAICGRELETELLVAAHIKPRSVCTEKERLDFNVVMPACLLGCDALFERGFVIVDGNGYVRKDVHDSGGHLNATLDALDGFKTPFFNPATERYFAWHRTNKASV